MNTLSFFYIPCWGVMKSGENDVCVVILSTGQSQFMLAYGTFKLEFLAMNFRTLQWNLESCREKLAEMNYKTTLTLKKLNLISAYQILKPQPDCVAQLVEYHQS